MTLVNVKIFVVLKILPSLVSMQTPLFVNSCWGRQKWKSVPEEVAFIFTIFLLIIQKHLTVLWKNV